MPNTSWLTGEGLKVTGKKKRKFKSGGEKPLTPPGMKHVQTIRSFDGPGSRTTCRVKGCYAPIRIEVRKFTNGKEYNILDAVGGGLHIHQDG